MSDGADPILNSYQNRPVITTVAVGLIGGIIIGLGFWFLAGKFGNGTHERLRVEFSFYEMARSHELPPITELTAPLENGVVNVQVMATNLSNKSAFNPFIYIRLCKDCKYATEPEGFRYVPGAQPMERERHYDRLLGLTRLPMISLSLIPPSNAELFPIGFYYGCDDCEPIDGDKPQILTVRIQKPSVAKLVGTPPKGAPPVPIANPAVITLVNAIVTRGDMGKIDISLLLENSGGPTTAHIISSVYMDGSRQNLAAEIPDQLAFATREPVHIRFPDLFLNNPIGNEVWAGTRKLEIELEVHYDGIIYRYRGLLDGSRPGMNTSISRSEGGESRGQTGRFHCVGIGVALFLIICELVGISALGLMVRSI